MSKSVIFACLLAVVVAKNVELRDFDVVSNLYDMCKSGVPCGGAFKKSSEENGTCFEDRSCKNIIVMENGTDATIFHLFASSGNVSDPYQYVSIGFSNDTDMGEEAVVSCVAPDASSNVKFVVSRNEGKRNVATDNNEALTGLGSVVTESFLYCNFTLNTPLSFARSVIDNGEDSFYIVAVAGTVNEGGSLGHHSVRIVTPEKWTLNSAASVVACTLLLALSLSVTLS